MSDFSVNSDNNYKLNNDTCPKDDRTSDSSKDDEIVNMSKISNASQTSIILNNEIIQIQTKLIDESWNFFTTYFLSTGLL
ncbi:9390_t:CDS:2, partial [Gigaspora rosea]